MFECDSAHCRSVALLCILYKIMCNQMHALNGALPGPYVPVRVTRGALVAHRHAYAPPRCRTSQHRRTFIPQGPSGTILLTQYSMVWDWRVSKSGPMLLYWPKLLYPYNIIIVFYCFPLSLLSVYRLVLWCQSLRTDRCTSLSLSALHCRPLLIIVIKKWL